MNVYISMCFYVFMWIDGLINCLKFAVPCCVLSATNFTNGRIIANLGVDGRV